MVSKRRNGCDWHGNGRPSTKGRTAFAYGALLGAGLLAFALVDVPTAHAACVGGPVFNCSGADAAGTITYVATPAPTYNLIGETITGAGGNGINVQTTDANVANTATVAMDAASSITLTGINLNRGLRLETNGAGITVNSAGAITTVGGNSIFASIIVASTAAVSITTTAGGAMTGRITGFTTGSGNVTITTGDTVSLVVGSGGVTEGTSAIDADSFGGGHVTVRTNAAVTSFFDGIQGTTLNGGPIDITTGSGSTVNAGRVGIIAEAQVGTGAVNVTTNAPVLTTGAFPNAFGIFAMSDGGNVNVTTNATVGNFGIRAFSGVGGFTTGNVTVNANANVTGNGTFGALNASTTDGLLTINVSNGATIAAANAAADAIHAQTTGLGAVAITLASGTTANGTGGGILVDQSTGSGSTVINNNGSVVGSGSAAKPVISIATNGTATLNNNASIFSLTASPASLAIAETGGTATINNAGSVIGRVTATNATFNNVNSWTVFGTNSFVGAAAINNSGTLAVAGTAGNGGSITDFVATGILAVGNTGSLSVSGSARFIGAPGSSFANAGGLIDMRQGVVGDMVTISGNFGGGANSRLGVDTFLGAAASRSDQLVISGNATANTGIIVRDVNPGPGGFTGPGGIPIVTVNGTSTPGNFSLSPASTVIGGSYLPINGGVLRKGLFDYMLVDDPSVFALVSAPNTALFQMPVAITATQNIWYETAFGWEDRQTELRDFFHRGQAFAATLPGNAMPVKAPAPAPAAPPAQPGIWLKAVGSWTNRSDAQNFPLAGMNLPVDLGYRQGVYGVIGGVDIGHDAVFSRDDAVVLGLMGGYVNSSLNFGANPVTFAYSGGTAGASATYLNGGFFADTLVKADFLQLGIGGLPVEAGTTSTTVHALTIGAMSNVGYHVERAHVFVEPLATLAYTQTRIDSIGLPAAGVVVNFNNEETLRGAVGARVGSRLVEAPAFAVDASVIARIWDQFRGNNTVAIANFGLPLALTDNFTGAFGEVTGHLDFIARGTGLSGFVAGGVKFNRDFTTTSAKGGVRYQF
jgi:outer membrane autotransporter protein